MERKELALLLTRSTAAGAAKALEQCGTGPLAISKSQAYRLYGRSDVDRWLAEGLIKPIQQHGTISKNRIDKVALERIASRSNRSTYLPVAER